MYWLFYDLLETILGLLFLARLYKVQITLEFQKIIYLLSLGLVKRAVLEITKSYTVSFYQNCNFVLSIPFRFCVTFQESFQNSKFSYHYRTESN